MASWQNGKLAKWQVGKMKWRQIIDQDKWGKIGAKKCLTSANVFLPKNYPGQTHKTFFT
jgi:hypothetical protein